LLLFRTDGLARLHFAHDLRLGALQIPQHNLRRGPLLQLGPGLLPGPEYVALFDRLSESLRLFLQRLVHADDLRPFQRYDCALTPRRRTVAPTAPARR